MCVCPKIRIQHWMIYCTKGLYAKHIAKHIDEYMCTFVKILIVGMTNTLLNTVQNMPTLLNI